MISLPQDQIATHFTFLRKQLKDREEKLLAVVEGLASEKLRALENQKSRMQTIVSACEKAINSTDELLQGDDWSLWEEEEEEESEDEDGEESLLALSSSPLHPLAEVLSFSSLLSLLSISFGLSRVLPPDFHLQVATAIAGTCKLDAEWSEKIQANLPGTLEEIIESHGVVSLASIEM
eukprot:761784-Hanusia_phi.AAC.2